MNKIFSLILLTLSSMMSGTWAAELQESDMGGYLMVYHKDQDHGLHMAVSYDGYEWVGLNGDKAIIGGDTIAEQHGIRDPHIFRAPNGDFYLAMTDLHVYGKRDGYRDTEWERDGKKYGWGNNRGLVLMKSSDLKHWTRTNLDFTKLGVIDSTDWREVGCVWAPETVWDYDTNQLMVHFTTRFGNGKNSIYYMYMNEDFTEMLSKPEELFAAPEHRYNVIDSDIIHVGDTYHLFYVSHESGATPRHAYSKGIKGPWTIDDTYYDGERQGHEAPNCWKRIGEDKYVVMFDNFRRKPMNFGFVETRDFFTYQNLGYYDDKGGRMTRLGFEEQKHGAVIWLTKAEADDLLKTYNPGQNYHPRRYFRADIPMDSIRMSDPCILADTKTKMYYMTGTGGMMWTSPDLKRWTGPYRVTEHDTTSWMGKNPMIWAAELHQRDDKYYYFATFTNRETICGHFMGQDVERRACHVLVADHPMGPYRPMADPMYLPANRPTLDGTLWTEPDGKSYMIYCGEWLEQGNGTMECIQLKPDYSGTLGKAKVLFRAFDNLWSRQENEDGSIGPNKVTDGPYLFRTETGRLGMIWTSWIHDVYTQGVAYSKSGKIKGPWVQSPEPITPPNFGHAMIFRDFDGRLLMSIHSHAKDAQGRTVRIPHLFEVDLSGDDIKVGKMIQ